MVFTALSLTGFSHSEAPTLPDLLLRKTTQKISWDYNAVFY